MRRKNILRGLLCAAVLLGAALVGAQEVSARETLLISGNADLYPIESYDRGRECYVGLLPELYERLSEQTGYDLVYLPYSKNTTQAQQAENRQADIISAYPSGTVDSGAMRRQVLLCTIEHDGTERDICWLYQRTHAGTGRRACTSAGGPLRRGEHRRPGRLYE